MEPSTWHLSGRKRTAMAGVSLPCDCRHAEIITDTPTKAVSMRCRRSFAAIEGVYRKEISRMRYLVPLPLITALLASLNAQGAGDQSFEFRLKEHKFSPQ